MTSCEPARGRIAADGEARADSRVVLSIEGAQFQTCLRRDLFVLRASGLELLSLGCGDAHEACELELRIPGDELTLAFEYGSFRAPVTGSDAKTSLGALLLVNGIFALAFAAIGPGGAGA